ncbi:MAG: DNA methyltransferase [Candidatus Cryptobacteroides sp.]
MDITPVHNEIPLELRTDAILDIRVPSVTSYTHGFHKYPAKFIPQIPSWAIKRYIGEQTGKLILDPFSGSGTTLVEASLSGNYSLGIDIDPLSVLIAKVKTTPLNLPLLNTVAIWLRKTIQSYNGLLFNPVCDTIDHWFPAESIDALARIRTVIELIPNKFGKSEEVKDIYDFLIVCFSSIIRRVSYADNESQKTYVSHTHKKEPEAVGPIFDKQLDYFVERISQFSQHSHLGEARIVRASSSEPLAQWLNGETADLAITSPPYIKAIDYIYNQMAELFWIGDLFEMDTQRKQNAKKVNYVGNKQIPAKEYSGFIPSEHRFGIGELDDKIEEVFVTDQKNGLKHSYVAYKYFKLMEGHFEAISECLKDGAHYIFVVGDSDVSNIHFSTAAYLTDQALRYGLVLTNRWGYIIKNRFMRFDRKGRGGKIDIDWVLDFQKQ